MTSWTKLLSDIAKKIIEQGRDQIEKNNSNASGRLSNTLEYRVSGNIIEIIALRYGDYLDTGTGPRKSKNGPGFYDKIKEWVAYKNIDPSAAWPIYKTILEKGTKPHPWVWRMREYALDEVSKHSLDFLSTVIHDEFTVKFEKLWI